MSCPPWAQARHQTCTQGQLPARDPEWFMGEILARDQQCTGQTPARDQERSMGQTRARTQACIPTR
jgi:hypothetical protein